MKRFVVCYDVATDKERIKIMKELKKLGFHAQLSFFEIEARSVEEIINRVGHILSSADRLAIGRISRKGKIMRVGSLFESTEWVL